MSSRSIAATSSVVRAKSKTLKFSEMRWGLMDFGIAEKPWSKCQRKVTTLPCGRSKEIKKTLRTRDKSEAKRKVLELLACVRSSGKTHAADPLPSSFQEQANLQASDPIVVPRQPERQESTQRKPHRPVETPKLSKLADKYLKERSMSWAAQETRHQKHYLYTFIEQAGDRSVTQYGKRDAV